MRVKPVTLILIYRHFIKICVVVSHVTFGCMCRIIIVKIGCLRHCRLLGMTEEPERETYSVGRKKVFIVLTRYVWAV